MLSGVHVCGGAQTYPTIRMFVDDGFDDYLGLHTSEALYAWVKMQLVNNVVPITPQSFESLVVNTQDLWLIDFSAGAVRSSILTTVSSLSLCFSYT